MGTFDAVVAGVFLSSTGGVLVFRAICARRRFRVQERTTAILVEGVRILEDERLPAPAERDETR